MTQYVIISILEPDFPLVFQKADYPLHVTLLRSFETDVPNHTLADTLHSICKQHRALSSQGKSIELFGSNSDRPVTELVNTPELQKLHDDIRSAYIDEIEFTTFEYPNFRPHVTRNNGKSIQVGEKVLIKTVSLIELASENRKVLATFQLM